MSRYTDLCEEVSRLRLRISRLEKEKVKKEYPFNPSRGEPDYSTSHCAVQTSVDLSPVALFKRIEQLAGAVGVELQYRSAVEVGSKYEAVKIKKEAK